MVENISPRQTWQALQSDPQAQLVDVRTDAEWNFVGLPDLLAAAKQPVLIPWQIFPSMAVNAAFTDQMKQAGLTPEHKIYFLCRSGVRSQAPRRRRRSRPDSRMPTISPTALKAPRTPKAIAAPLPAGRPTSCPGDRGKQVSPALLAHLSYRTRITTAHG
jgi:rhodanese-related sulfurtransferase